MPKAPKPTQEAPQETLEPEAAPKFSPVLDLPDDLTVKVDEVHQNLPAQSTEPAFSKDDYNDAEDENRKRDFVHDILQARQTPAVKEYTPPPIPEPIAERTRLEMEAGRKRVAEHADQQARNPRPPKQEDTTTVAVFRPEDYVPDPKKGEGIVASNSARTL